MTTRSAKLHAIGEWCLEVSALLTVFPWLDQIVHGGTFNWTILYYCVPALLIFGAIGLYLVRGDDR